MTLFWNVTLIPTRLTPASQWEGFKTALMPNEPSYILICYFYEGQVLSNRTLLIWMLLTSAVSCPTCVNATEVRALQSYAHLQSQLIYNSRTFLLCPPRCSWSFRLCPTHFMIGSWFLHFTMIYIKQEELAMPNLKQSLLIIGILFVFSFCGESLHVGKVRAIPESINLFETLLHGRIKK